MAVLPVPASPVSLDRPNGVNGIEQEDFPQV